MSLACTYVFLEYFNLNVGSKCVCLTVTSLSLKFRLRTVEGIDPSLAVSFIFPVRQELISLAKYVT